MHRDRGLSAGLGGDVGLGSFRAPPGRPGVERRLEDLPVRHSLNSKRSRASARISRFGGWSVRVKVEIPRGILESAHVWTCKNTEGSGGVSPSTGSSSEPTKKMFIDVSFSNPGRVDRPFTKEAPETKKSGSKKGPDTPHPDLTGWDPEETKKTGVFL